VAVYDAAGRPLAVTESLSSLLQSPPKLAAEALDRDAGMGHLERVGNAVFSSTEETTPLV
jgi:hypothetical protein